MDNYIRVDQKLHSLSQTITKANRTFIPTVPDDSNTNLYFDSMGKRIVGRWIKTPNRSVILTLNLESLKFEWVNSSYEVIYSFQIVGKKTKDIEEEISSHLLELGLDSAGFIDKLHFEIPAYSFADEVIQSISETDLNLWKHYRTIADKACALLLGYLQIEGEIRIWPHHFDTGIYVVTKNGMGIGFGLAMEDSLIGNPYFYMSAYPSKGSIEFIQLPDFPSGRWEVTPNWKGAVLPLNELSGKPMDQQLEVIKSHILVAVRWYLNNK